MFYGELGKILKNTISTEHLRATPSVPGNFELKHSLAILYFVLLNYI